MFDSLKAAGAIASLMKNKEGLKAAGERIRSKLGEMRIQGGSGGGAVRAVVSGDMRVISITMDPPVLAGLGGGDERSREMVQLLIVDAVNNAMDLAKAAAAREVSKETEALGLPNMPGMEGLLGG